MGFASWWSAFIIGCLYRSSAYYHIITSTLDKIRCWQVRCKTQGKAKIKISYFQLHKSPELSYTASLFLIKLTFSSILKLESTKNWWLARDSSTVFLISITFLPVGWDQYYVNHMCTSPPFYADYQLAIRLLYHVKYYLNQVPI